MELQTVGHNWATNTHFQSVYQQVFKLNYVHLYDGKLLKYDKSISTDKETYIYTIYLKKKIYIKILYTVWSHSLK